jgi:hypothetical protein
MLALSLRRLGPLGAGLVPLLLSLILTLPSGLGIGSANGSAAPPNTVGAAASAAPAITSAHSVLAMPHPAAGPTCPLGYPAWANVTVGSLPFGLDPPAPNFAGQTPCTLIYAGHDEVHGTFSSSLPNSADHASFEIHLPKLGSPGVPTLYDDLSVGEVVTGDSSSIGGQSFAELILHPMFVSGGTAVNYTAAVAVWSLLTNQSACAGLNFTWAGDYACEFDEDVNGSAAMPTAVRGGDFVNVSFVGNTTGSGLTIYLNDSTHASAQSQQLSKAKTGTHVFDPAWSAACPDSCKLNWSFPFGLAVGYDLCDNPPACTSFNNTTMVGSLPAVFFAPHFWNGTGYGGDYQYFAPQSDSGACSGVGGGQVIPCTLDMVNGEYPFWTFNGSALSLGPVWPWTTVTWGGAHEELDALGTANDSIPFFLQQVTNSSLGGYLAEGSPLTVSARAEDLGTVTTVLLNYSVPGGTPQSVAMPRISGTTSDGVYNYTIPAPSAPGKITYRVFAGGRADNKLTSPSVRGPAAEVTVGPLPHFRLWLNTSFAGCGGIFLNGTLWPSLTNLSLLPGTYPIVGVMCYKYNFGGWAFTGGARAWPDQPYSTLTLTASGSLGLDDLYDRPNDTLTLEWNTSPACGTILFDGTAYSSLTTLTVEDNETYSLGETGCTGNSFSGWTATVGLFINDTTVYVGANGTISSNWVASVDAVSLLLIADPGGSGGIEFQGAAYVNNTTLYLVQGQSYSLHQYPYGGWGFQSWSVSGSVTLGGGQVTINGPSTVTAHDYRLTIVKLVISPPGGGSVVFDTHVYTGGALINVTNNSANSVFPRAASGYTYVSMGGAPVQNLSVVNGSTLLVHGDGTLTVNFERGSGTAFIEFQTDPAGCGSIEFNGVNYTNSQYTEVPPGLSVGVAPWPCPGFGFVKWLTSGGVSVNGGTANVSAIGGTLLAEFHQLALIRVYTTPGTCGQVVLHGESYSNGASLELPIYAWTTLSEIPCSDYHFSNWVNTTGSLINSTAVYIIGPTLLTAVYSRNTYAVTVLVTPAGCGGLKVGSLTVFNNTTLVLTSGPYRVSAEPCPTFELLGYSTSGNVSVGNGTLAVTGAGSVGVNYGPVPPKLTLFVPSSSYAGISVELTAQIAVPVVPLNGYKYDWNFGDGSSLVTAGNFTNHVYTTTGTYTVSLEVIDPYGRTANGTGTLSVVHQPAVTSSLPLAGYAVIGLIAFLLFLAVAVALRRRSLARRPPKENPPTGNVQEPPKLPSEAPPPALSPQKETDAAEQPP